MKDRHSIQTTQNRFFIWFPFSSYEQVKFNFSLPADAREKNMFIVQQCNPESFRDRDAGPEEKAGSGPEGDICSSFMLLSYCSTVLLDYYKEGIRPFQLSS